MSSPIITVENLGKCYRLQHQQRERYTALRDVITSKVKGLFGKRKAESGKQNSEEDFWALKDVSFEIKQGEVVGIIGRNGAGKSTLLKILSRITEPTSGRITLRGRVASLLEVGTGFHPELTGRENIFLNGAILGMSRQEVRRKFDEIVDFAEVEKFLDTPVKRYSSGMYVRLAFAVAAHLEPEILVVDEVLAVGDAAFQQKCLGKMKNVAQGEGRTVLFVSHNMGAMRSLCPRGIYLKTGKVANDGEVGIVIDAYGSDSQTAENYEIKGEAGFGVESVILRLPSGGATTSFSAGDGMIVEINYRAEPAILKPYFWLEIHSRHGAAFSACMLFDGIRPDRISGAGKVSCHFHHLPLMPGAYTVRMGARRSNGVELLMRSQEVGYFNISSSLADMGLHGELGESLSVDAAPVLLPYTWHLPEGVARRVEVQLESLPTIKDHTDTLLISEVARSKQKT